MHPAQVVAVPVLAGRRVVLPVYGDRAGPGVARTGVVGGQPDPGQRYHRRRDGQVVHGREGAGQLAQPERVGQPDHQRTHLVPAADVGPDRVRHGAGLAPAEPFEHQPGSAAQRVRQPVLQQHRAGGQRGQVLQPQHHPGTGPDRGTGRLQRPGAGQLVPGPSDVPRGEQGEQPDQDGHPEQVLLAQDDRGEEHGDRAREERLAPRGQPPQPFAHGHGLRSYGSRGSRGRPS